MFNSSSSSSSSSSCKTSPLFDLPRAIWQYILTRLIGHLEHVSRLDTALTNRRVRGFFLDLMQDKASVFEGCGEAVRGAAWYANHGLYVRWLWRRGLSVRCLYLREEEEKR